MRFGHNDHDHDDNHDRGLAFDLETLMTRRRAMMLFSGAALATLIGCSSSDDGGSTPATSTSSPSSSTGSTGSTATTGSQAAATVSPIPTTATPASACTTAIPSETAGPFPGDGSNGPNALTQSGIVRKDIRSSFGTSTKMAEGVPLSVVLTVVDTKNGCKPMSGAAVYIWHCDAVGLYSMYSQGATNENYLRGVQEADANGVVTFTTTFPGAYAGRWPHIHFEVFPSLASASSSNNDIATSQLALPEDACAAVYATSGYGQSASNLRQTPLSRDGIFSDGYSLQMAATAGSISSGYTATLLVGV